MKFKILLFLTLLFSLTASTYSQNIDTLSASKDANIRAANNIGTNQNLGSSQFLMMQRWTNRSNPTVLRTFIDFDLSNIPQNAQIIDAKLELHSDSIFMTQILNQGGHYTSSGLSNNCYLQRVTSPWNENTINWLNQPSSTSHNQIALPGSTSRFQDYSVNVTTLVQDMIDSSNSHGFYMFLQSEAMPYKRLAFASRDHQDSTLHPQLIVEYISTVGLNESKTKNISYSISPNPSENFVNVKLSSPLDQVTLEIRDMGGRLVYSEFFTNLSETRIQMPEAKGIYFLGVQSLGEQKVFKLIRR